MTVTSDHLITSKTLTNTSLIKQKAPTYRCLELEALKQIRGLEDSKIGYLRQTLSAKNNSFPGVKVRMGANEDIGSRQVEQLNDNSLSSLPLTPQSSINKRAAFTLAEVLITLGIIGIVAAMTLPTLIQNYQKKQTISQLQKAYSELSQALNIAQKDHGTIDSWDLSDFENPLERNQYFLQNYLEPNLKILKKCEPTSHECFSTSPKNFAGEVLDLHKSLTFNGTEVSFITASGYSAYFWVHSVGNGAWFYVDLNGKKNPNTLGKDIFVFRAGWGNIEKVPGAGNEYLGKLGLFAYGLDSKQSNPSRENLIDGSTAIHSTSGCSKLNNGDTCAALIIGDGWQIADDYPW